MKPSARITVAVLVVVAVVIVCSELFPRKRTAEFHKDAYLKAQERLSGGMSQSRWIGGWAYEWKARKMMQHHRALLELGFLEERSVPLSNASPNVVTDRLLDALLPNGMVTPEAQKLGLEYIDFKNYSNELTFISTKTAADVIEKLIRKADALEIK